MSNTPNLFLWVAHTHFLCTFGIFLEHLFINIFQLFLTNGMIFSFVSVSVSVQIFEQNFGQHSFWKDGRISPMPQGESSALDMKPGVLPATLCEAHTKASQSPPPVPFCHRSVPPVGPRCSTQPPAASSAGTGHYPNGFSSTFQHQCTIGDLPDPAGSGGPPDSKRSKVSCSLALFSVIIHSCQSLHAHSYFWDFVGKFFQKSGSS